MIDEWNKEGYRMVISFIYIAQAITKLIAVMHFIKIEYLQIKAIKNSW
jgi:hypothetical protein